MTSFNVHFKKYKLIFKVSFPEIAAEVFKNVVKILLTWNLKGMGLMPGKNSPIVSRIIDLLFLERLLEKLYCFFEEFNERKCYQYLQFYYIGIL